VIRLGWLLLGIVLCLAGANLVINGWLGWSGWFVLGVGGGVGLAVIGSWSHDLLTGWRDH
jgi:hypothetical protein